MPTEPSLAALPNPLIRYFLAIRPAFLGVTLTACLIGLAGAAADGLVLHAGTALVTVIFALVAHAGVNVLNDYYDSRNGGDAANCERIFPFTGGSRFIQNGVLTQSVVGWFGLALLVMVVPAGLWLAWRTGAGLVAVGAAGLLIGWAYSAPPLALASRGLGELAVAAGWLLLVIGTDYVQRGGFSATPVFAGLAHALLVANILYINQFPDLAADRAVGKLTLVVRLGARRARWGYVLLAAAAYLWVAVCVVGGALPVACAIALLALPLSLRAALALLRDAAAPARLEAPIKASIAAALDHGLLMAGALAAVRVFG